MRGTLIVIGLILIVAGAAVWSGKLTYPHDREVIKVGDLSATVNEDRAVPQWIGGIAALLGIGLVAAGALRKR